MSRVFFSIVGKLAERKSLLQCPQLPFSLNQERPLRGPLENVIGVNRNYKVAIMEWIRKQIRCTPEKLYTGCNLLFFCIIDNRPNSFMRFRDSCPFIHDIKIVAALKRSAAFSHKLEGSIHLGLCSRDWIVGFKPAEIPSVGPELIAASISKRVPVCSGKSHVILKCFSCDYFLRTVPLEREKILGPRPFVHDLFDSTGIFRLTYC